MTIGACGGGGGGGDDLSLEGTVGPTTADTALPACSDASQMVALTVFGFATGGDRGEAGRWVDDPEAQPVAREGAARVVQAYRDLGYKILYISSLPSEVRINDQPLADALMVWLGLNGFPIGSDDTQVWAWDGDGDASVALIQKLVMVDRTGGDVVAAYTGDPDTVFPLVSGGIPRERLFALGEATSDEAATALPDDLGQHLPDVQALARVCE